MLQFTEGNTNKRQSLRAHRPLPNSHKKALSGGIAKNPERRLTESKGGSGGGKRQMLLEVHRSLLLRHLSHRAVSVSRSLGHWGAVAKGEDLWEHKQSMLLSEVGREGR